MSYVSQIRFVLRPHFARNFSSDGGRSPTDLPSDGFDERLCVRFLGSGHGVRQVVIMADPDITDSLLLPVLWHTCNTFSGQSGVCSIQKV